MIIYRKNIHKYFIMSHSLLIRTVETYLYRTLLKRKKNRVSYINDIIICNRFMLVIAFTSVTYAYKVCVFIISEVYLVYKNL